MILVWMQEAREAIVWNRYNGGNDLQEDKMKPRSISERVQLFASIDWSRKLFDALIPLPDGTSYNAYLVRGAEKIALMDTTDPAKTMELMAALENVPVVDYLISNHAEQDHSGTIPAVLNKYPKAKLICSEKAKSMLIDLVEIAENRITTVKDGETLSLGDRTLEFISTPWVHWPETMSTYLREEQILFSCDFFGSHLATSDIYVRDEGHTLRCAKRYYAEIMMPFRAVIQKNLEKLEPYPIKVIAPSHGPVYNHPEFIVAAYKDWVSSPPHNLVIVPYISMHHSTETLVERLVDDLSGKGIPVQSFDMTRTDIGELAIGLVDAATIILGVPIMHGNAHPVMGYTARLAALLKPKALFAAFLVSYGWGVGAVDRLPELITGLKVEALANVVVRGLPREADLEAVDKLADLIESKHKGLGLK
jgi:flavorubredoxin